LTTTHPNADYRQTPSTQAFSYLCRTARRFLDYSTAVSATSNVKSQGTPTELTPDLNLSRNMVIRDFGTIITARTQGHGS
jgi:hypothetical protein